MVEVREVVQFGKVEEGVCQKIPPLDILVRVEVKTILPAPF